MALGIEWTRWGHAPHFFISSLVLQSSSQQDCSDCSSMPFFCTHHLIKHGYQPMIDYVFTYCACTPGAVVFVHVVTSTGPYDGLLLYFWRIGSGQCSMLLAKLYMVALTLISFVIEESLMMEWMEWTCGTGAYSPRQTLSLLISKSFL